MSNQAAGGRAVLDEDGRRRCRAAFTYWLPAHPKGDERWSDGFHPGGAFDASCTWSDARAATHDCLQVAKKPQLPYKHVGMCRNGDAHVMLPDQLRKPRECASLRTRIERSSLSGYW
jgi:hypothetical protein